MCLIPGGVGWPTFISCSGRASNLSWILRGAWWHLKCQEQSLGEGAGWSAVQFRVGSVLQGCSLHDICWCLQSIVHCKWSHKVNNMTFQTMITIFRRFWCSAITNLFVHCINPCSCSLITEFGSQEHRNFVFYRKPTSLFGICIDWLLIWNGKCLWCKECCISCLIQLKQLLEGALSRFIQSELPK